MKTAVVKRPNDNPTLSFGNFVDNIFQNSLRRFLNDDVWDTGTPPTTGSSVPVNVREMELHYEMDVIAPGCKKEDFDINVDNNILTISFTQREERNDKNNMKGWIRNEYVVKSFSRSFAMDDTVDVGKISAIYQDGILQIVLPKNEKAQRLIKNIEIK